MSLFLLFDVFLIQSSTLAFMLLTVSSSWSILFLIFGVCLIHSSLLTFDHESLVTISLLAVFNLIYLTYLQSDIYDNLFNLIYFTYHQKETSDVESLVTGLLGAESKTEPPRGAFPTISGLLVYFNKCLFNLIYLTSSSIWYTWHIFKKRLLTESHRSLALWRQRVRLNHLKEPDQQSLASSICIKSSIWHIFNLMCLTYLESAKRDFWWRVTGHWPYGGRE